MTLWKKKDKFPDLIQEYRGEIPLDELSWKSGYKALWQCKECSHTWTTVVANRTGQGSGCPRCSSSKLEKKTRVILIQQNISFQEQYRLSQNTRTSLSIDFLLTYRNIIIAVECQGIQHYKSGKFFGSKEPQKDFEALQQRDCEKKELLKMLNIPLIEVRYDEPDIETFLSEELSHLSHASLS